MKLDLMLIIFKELQDKKRHVCIDDLINLLQMDNRAVDVGWTSAKKEMVRRRIAYLQSDNMVLYDNHHYCYYCGRRKAKTVTLSKFLYNYLEVVVPLYKEDKNLCLSILNIIGKPKEFAMAVLFLKYMKQFNADYITTGRQQADLIGSPYKSMLLYLNVLEKKGFFTKDKIKYRNIYRLNSKLVELLNLFQKENV